MFLSPKETYAWSIPKGITYLSVYLSDNVRGQIPVHTFVPNEGHHRSSLCIRRRFSKTYFLHASQFQCDPGVGMHILYDQIYNKPTKIMLLGAAFSPVSQPIADTSKYWNLLQVSKDWHVSTIDFLQRNNRYVYYSPVLIVQLYFCSFFKS